MRVCLEPGCPILTDQSRCEWHRKAKRRQSDAKRPNSSARGYDAKWRRTRANYKRSHPICEDESGCIEPATDVHHLDGLGPNGPRGHDPENLRSLCHKHHSQVTAREQSAGWNSPR